MKILDYDFILEYKCICIKKKTIYKGDDLYKELKWSMIMYI